MANGEPLARAAAAFGAAARRLQEARRAASLGRHDPAAFDTALAAYRQAATAMQQARQEARGAAPPPTGAASPPPDPLAVFRRAFEADALFEPTARLRFVKWLVTTGRLSDER